MIQNSFNKRGKFIGLLNKTLKDERNIFRELFSFQV